jgi:SAM-dependent methyltransferase
MNDPHDSQLDYFYGVRRAIDFRPDAREDYERRVASKERVLDVGGRNDRSRSHRRLRELSTNPGTQIVSTDVVTDYEPDLVDDICHSTIEAETYDGVYLDAILEHVEEYWLAMDHIHRILKPGGETFIYVPFFWQMHDLMDYHRFTVAELGRLMESRFSEYRLFLPDSTGIGGVAWDVSTLYLTDRFPKARRFLAKVTNIALVPRIALRSFSGPRKQGRNDISFQEYRFLWTHIYVNHGFCAWAKK